MALLARGSRMLATRICTVNNRSLDVAVSSSVNQFVQPQPIYVIDKKGHRIRKSMHSVLRLNVLEPRPQRTRSETKSLVLEMIQKFDRFPKDKKDILTMDSHLINDIGMDSLDHVEIMMMFEKYYDIIIPEEDLEDILTPRLIFEYLCDHQDIVME